MNNPWFYMEFVYSPKDLIGTMSFETTTRRVGV